MRETVLEVNDLNVWYRSGTGLRKRRHQVLHDVSFTLYRGEILGLVGESGCGKSTLLRQLKSDLAPYGSKSGRICYYGQNLTEIDHRQQSQEIGYVLQNPDNQIIGTVVEEDVGFGPENMGVPTDDIWKRVNDSLEKVGMTAYRYQSPNKLSGGQKQRVAIARALANDPQVLLCDEATSALDPQTTKAILHLLKHLNETLGITIVLITHEMAVVKEICDRVAVMEYGRVVEQGEVFTVFAEPKQDITKSFIHTTSNLQKVEALIAEDSPVTRLQPGELIVRLSYVQRNVNEPIISAVSQMFNVSLNIIFADITIVQDSPIGGTVAIISGERKQITKAIEYLIEKNVGVEVIKDARADR